MLSFEDKTDLRVRFSVSSSSFLVFREVLLEEALFEPRVAAKGKGIEHKILIKYKPSYKSDCWKRFHKRYRKNINRPYIAKRSLWISFIYQESHDSCQHRVQESKINNMLSLWFNKTIYPLLHDKATLVD